jgi:hypothetical protein
VAVRTFCALNTGQADDALARHAKGDTMPQDETAAPEEVSMSNAPAPAPAQPPFDWRLVLTLVGGLGLGSGGVATFTGGAQQSAAAVVEVKTEVTNLSKAVTSLDKNVALFSRDLAALTKDLDECSCTPSER